MHRTLAAVATLLVLGHANAADAAKAYPSCHMHKSRDVSFRNGTSKDVLEVSIGTGPCYAATLTVVLRSHVGEVLYSYVAPFKRHTAIHWEDPDLGKEAARFVEELVANGVGSSASLPPYLDPSAYYEENYGEVRVPRQTYETLRGKPRPMFEHATHYEGWRYVVFDQTKGEAIIVLSGGL
jgi:hypothetical protein